MLHILISNFSVYNDVLAKSTTILFFRSAEQFYLEINGIIFWCVMPYRCVSSSILLKSRPLSDLKMLISFSKCLLVFLKKSSRHRNVSDLFLIKYKLLQWLSSFIIKKYWAPLSEFSCFEKNLHKFSNAILYHFLGLTQSVHFWT